MDLDKKNKKLTPLEQTKLLIMMKYQKIDKIYIIIGWTNMKIQHLRIKKIKSLLLSFNLCFLRCVYLKVIKDHNFINDEQEFR